MTAQPYPILMANLTEKRAQSFMELEPRVAQYEQEGLLTATDHAWLKAGYNNAIEEAWKKAIRGPFAYNGAMRHLTDAEQKLLDKLYWPQSHLVAGFLKRARAATKAAGPMRDAVLAFLEEVTPLAERIVALKAKIGKRPPAPSKTSMARDERALLAMTCQCCGRDILAETGEIAHHGYQLRDGYQTASCYGALAVPFEVSRERLAEFIASLKSQLAYTRQYRQEVEDEVNALDWSYEDRTGVARWEKGTLKEVRVTRASFPDILAQTYEARHASPWDVHSERPEPTFDAVKKAHLGRLTFEINTLVGAIAYQESRYAGWKQTHERRDGAWVKL